ncbi:MAG TPA: hypothetical protein VJ184_11125, partial [Chryseolinea sp.]|nr:hypothetical protein [Chryseolinea sp.]
RENQEDLVTVSLSFLKEKSTKDGMVFEVSLDTHSVNLDNFNFQEKVILVSVNNQISPTEVELSGGGHHRSAEVTFTKYPYPFSIKVNGHDSIPTREFRFDEEP